MSLKESIAALHVPDTLKEFIPDLKEMHNIKTVTTEVPDKKEKEVLQNDSFVIKF
jgi:hypothetical protein